MNCGRMGTDELQPKKQRAEKADGNTQSTNSVVCRRKRTEECDRLEVSHDIGS